MSDILFGEYQSLGGRLLRALIGSRRFYIQPRLHELELMNTSNDISTTDIPYRMRITQALRAIKPPPKSSVSRSWTHTLNLPKSSFPPLPPPVSNEALDDVTRKLYDWQLQSRKDQEPFVLHDGPPYANGDLHLGHAINKVLKDIICRFQISQGKRVEYVPGWDCHGLPIELKALQQAAAAKKEQCDAVSALGVRELARKLASTTVESQKAEFFSWAVIGDWENAYKTMDKEYVTRELEIFKQLVEKDLISYERMPVYFSPSSKTVLAEAELEYDPNYVSKCAFVRYPLNSAGPFEEFRKDGVIPEQLGALIWTTTPWTLPGNKLIAVGSDITYCVAALERAPNCQFLVAESRLDFLKQQLLDESITVIKEGITGSHFAQNASYSGLGQGDSRLMVDADFVTDSAGTGLVHVAPGHGFDDFLLGKKHGIETISVVDEEARFHGEPFADSVQLAGESVWKNGSAKVLGYLESIQGRATNTECIIFGTHKIEHKYPIDWRTKEPVIILPKQQWFIKINALKDSAIASLESVQFIPESGKNRLTSFVKSRDHWCISRQRAWGVPLPILYGRREGELEWKPLISSEVIGELIKMIRHHASDDWFRGDDLILSRDDKWLPSGLDSQMEYKRSTDTMDVWFDSGTSWSLLTQDKIPPADIYLEGNDQHRGWFQSSLLTHVAQKGPIAPFKTLITHGMALDAEGRKMSKSLGNIISPKQLLLGQYGQMTEQSPTKKSKQKQPQQQIKSKQQALGADFLRYWIASIDYTKDVSVNQESLEVVSRNLKKLRITFKWLLGILKSYEPPEVYPGSPLNSLIDRIILYDLQEVSKAVHSSYVAHDFVTVTNTLRNYVVDLSSGYFEIVKDRIYTGTLEERTSAQYVLWHIYEEILKMLAPITPLMVREVNLSHSDQQTGVEDGSLTKVFAPFNVSAVLSTGDQVNDEVIQSKKLLSAAKQLVNLLQETARQKFGMGSGLECDVSIILRNPYTSGDAGAAVNENMSVASKLFRKGNEESLAAAMVVSHVNILDEPTFLARCSEAITLGSEEKSMDTGSVLSVEANSFGSLEEHQISRVITGKITIPLEVGGAETAPIPLYAQVTTPPAGSKCGRCWRYQETDEILGLCRRCKHEVSKRS